MATEWSLAEWKGQSSQQQCEQNQPAVRHTAVTAILTKPYSEDSRCGGAEGVVSIGNKGLEVAISLLNLGS